MMANNPRWAEVSAEANAVRARQAGQEQAVLARAAVAVLRMQEGPHVTRWIQALQHRIERPDATLAELSQAMYPPLTKNAYAALLRRALRGAEIAATAASSEQKGD
ncbi:MAG: hypothetical protein CK429_35720 [Mycobacterium sp.]|nr:MAG: hypothetical protein CK429_35720 [Mycobacterium sp.]PJE02463.1 MAG: hypothetical protein CK428_29805 [Mycobacterium sp.]PJE23039.1 MAG: hypothetical protein CK431_13270 [Mycobacterium sp.]